MCGIFLILFRSWVINKSVNNDCAAPSFFLIFENISRLKQNLKNPGHSFVDIGKKEMCAKF